MPNIVPTNVQLPAHLSSRIGAGSAVGNAMIAGTSSGFKRISKRGSRFRVRDGSEEILLPGNSLRGIIVGASPGYTKLFYKGTYDKDAEDKKPDCYSNDGVRPASDAKDPQAQLCATCENNVWGSKLTPGGTKTKACQDQRRLAIISADDDRDEPDVYLYTVTPSELTDFNAYAKQLASKGFPPELVVTEFSFDTDAEHPKVKFSFAGFVEEHKVPVIDSLVGSQTVQEITGEKPIVAQIVDTPKAKPSPVKTVEQAEPEVEVILEPAPKKSGFGGTPVKSTPIPADEPKVVQSSKLTSSIQDILDSMQDDDDE